MIYIKVIFFIFLFVLLNILLTSGLKLSSKYNNKSCTFTKDNFFGIYKPITFNCTTLPPQIYPNQKIETIKGLSTTYFCCPEKRVSEQFCDANEYSEMVEHSIGSTIPLDGEIPYIAAIFKQKIAREGEDPYKLKFICGGSIISEWYILSAAHCFLDIDEINYFISFGKSDIGNLIDDDLIKIIDIHVHDYYSSLIKNNDIAIIKPEKKINFIKFIMSPICLHSYKMNNGIFDDEPLKIGGWGKWNPKLDESSPILRKVELGYVNQTQCKQQNNHNGLEIIESQFCAFDMEFFVDKNNRSDACQGDSGGPVRILFNQRSVLVGVVSRGVGCGSKVPGIYTRVVSFIDWIESKVWLS